MKLSSEVSGEKLRGGFYTPPCLIEVCLDRIRALGNWQNGATVLEPSVGDGAFLGRLAGHSLAGRVGRFVGLEVVPAEAQKCRELAREMPFVTDIMTISALEWAASSMETFDIVLGNPPFVRYQFISSDDLKNIERLGQRLGLSFRGVSNLWIPILLGALSRLRLGGALALVVPAELFTGLSAGEARRWLLSNLACLRIDLFEPGSFPDVLQEVVVISGRRAADKGDQKTQVEFVEHTGPNAARSWSHFIPPGTASWTRYMLSAAQLEALDVAQRLPQVQPFGSLAKLEVSIVTGANDFFSVTNEERAEFELEGWAERLLPRIRHAPGLSYTAEDHAATAAQGAKAWLLNFGEQQPDPLSFEGASRYLALGESRNLQTRYKTSIRKPWYRVPSVWPGKLLLSKRCHWFPRLIYNGAGVLTTDTIYRGQMLEPYRGQELELIAAFHNSLTLLTAEIEGRSFGGGVLELVPSEIGRLVVPFPGRMGELFPRLDQIARSTVSNADRHALLIQETDALLSLRLVGLEPALLQPLQQAREFLLKRRLSRN